MKVRFSVLPLLVATAIAFAADEPSHKNTFDYIERTGRLWGVAVVSLNKDNSVTLEDANTPDYGYGLMMFDFQHNVVNSVTIKQGQSCSLADGHHVFLEYELKEVHDGKLTFVVTDRFDARSFGGKVEEEKKTITISPYKSDDKESGQRDRPDKK